MPARACSLEVINTRRISPELLSDAEQAVAPAAAAIALFLKKDLRCIRIHRGQGASKDIPPSQPRQPKCTPPSGAASSGKSTSCARQRLEMRSSSCSIQMLSAKACAIICGVNLAILIPTFRPAHELVDLVETIAQQPCLAIVIVNDGSESEYDPCFEAVANVPRVHVLRHSVNAGKGAALKTGFNFILDSLPHCMGVVTMDADGQHHPDDVCKVAEELLEHPDHLILGVRQFGNDVPLRSRFGNQATRLTFFLTTGQRLSDTQTGLRGIPRKMLPALLRLPSQGYEFELDMLLACNREAYPFQEVPIRTIYEKGNPTSHFNPLLDSLRIYFVLLRYSLLSLATAVVDNIAFVLAFFAFSSILYAQIIGRLVAVLFNYPLAHGAVFLSPERRLAPLPKYLMLVVASGAVAYVLIHFIHTHFSVGVIWAKLSVESTLFIVNFAIQRHFVFTRPVEWPDATDWNRYLTSTPFRASLTRKYTESVIVRMMRQFGGLRGTDAIVEIGGANSCLLDRIMAEFNPGAYHVVDSNRFGLDLLRRRLDNRRRRATSAQ